MYSGENLYGMDQISPIMDDANELYDYSNIVPKIVKEDKKEKFTNEEISNAIQPLPQQIKYEYQPEIKYQYKPSTNELIKSIYNQLSHNIMYLFVIFILIIICIAQKNSMDQMKLLLMISMNNNLQNNIIKTPIS